MKRSWFLTFIAILTSIGLWHTGQSLWIYLKAEFAQRLLELAWSKTLEGGKQVKPWPWADTWPIGRLLVPRHNVDLIILANANGRTLAFGPGHEPISTPLGETGTSILSGHRDTHFTFLKLLNVGEHILIQLPNGTMTPYSIQFIEIVDARQTSIRLYSTPHYLVLVTCYPFDAMTPGGPLRYVVTAQANTSGSLHSPTQEATAVKPWSST